MGKTLRFAGLVLVMLLLSAIPVGANTEVKITTTLTALDPVTGVVTGDPDGRGKAEFTFDTDQGTICYELEVEGIAEPVEPAPGLGSAHIHFLATGGIAVDLKADFQADKSDEFKASGCVEVDSALLQDILENPDQFYVNIHNADFPGGALSRLLSG
jgi:CHRD domain